MSYAYDITYIIIISIISTIIIIIIIIVIYLFIYLYLYVLLVYVYTTVYASDLGSLTLTWGCNHQKKPSKKEKAESSRPFDFCRICACSFATRFERFW